MSKRKTTKRTVRAVGARIYWRVPLWNILFDSRPRLKNEQPVLVLPLDPASLAAAREQVVKGLFKKDDWFRKWNEVPEWVRSEYITRATDSLAALHPSLKGKHE